MQPLPFVLAVVVSFSFFRYLHDSLKLAIDSLFIDFAHYYTFATVVAQGLNPFDPVDVAQVDALLHIRRAAGGADYPPLFYVLMQPWTRLPFRASAVVWLLASQVCLAAAVALCLRGARAPTPARLGMALFVVLNFQPLTENLAVGNSNVVLLLLVTVAWWGLTTNRGWVAALVTALALHVKVQYGLFIPLLWWMGYRRTCLHALALASLGVAAGLAAGGPSVYDGYVGLLKSSSVEFTTWTANLSPRASLHRLLGGTTEGAMVADAVWLVLAGLWLVLLAHIVCRARDKGAQVAEWAWGLGVVSVLVLSPMTEEHHLTIALLPLLLVVLMTPDFRSLNRMDYALFVGCVLLVGSRYSLERFPVFHQGLPSLLMTGKTVGVLLLAWLLIRLLRRESTAFHEGPAEPGEKPSTPTGPIGAWWQARYRLLDREYPGGATEAVLLLILVVSFSAARYALVLFKAVLVSPFIDFAHYYFYTTLVAMGSNPFDPLAIVQGETQLGIRHAMAPANYPPLFYLLMQPWAWLPFRTSAAAWLFLSQACVAGTIVLCCLRSAPVMLPQAGAVLYVVLNYQPLIEEDVLGQSNAVLLAVMTAAWCGLRAEAPWLAAVALAVAVHIKVQYVVLLPWLYWLGYRRVSAYGALLAAAGVMAGLVVLGKGHYAAYWQTLLASPDSLVSWADNLSLRAILHRAWGMAEGGWFLADWFWIASSAAVLALCARVVPRPVSPASSALDWSFGLGLVAMLLVAPVMEEHHIVVLLLPLSLLLLSMPEERMLPTDGILLLASVLLLGSLYSLTRFSFFDRGLWSLLGVGKSAGIVCLGWLLVRRLRAGQGAGCAMKERA